MTSNETNDFENEKFNPFDKNNNILLDTFTDPDENVFIQNNLDQLDAKYCNPGEFKTVITSSEKNSFSILHSNIRSIKKNFDKFKHMLSKLEFQFKVICLTETWSNDPQVKNNSHFQLPNYSVIHQIRASKSTGGGVCIFVHNSLCYKLRKELCVNDDNCESLTIEIINRNTKNMLVTCLYRQPAGKIKPFKEHVKNIFSKTRHSNKPIYISGDLNLNVLDYDTNKKVKNFFDLIFQHGLVPVINKPTRVTRRNATAIDHIITNSFFQTKLETGIIKCDISDHFPIFMITDNKKLNSYSDHVIINKREMTDNSLNYFKNVLNEVNWERIKEYDNVDSAYEVFLSFFSEQYEKAFPKKEIKIKTRNLLSPWMTKGLLKSSKKKQKLYEKFLKKEHIKITTFTKIIKIHLNQ